MSGPETPVPTAHGKPWRSEYCVPHEAGLLSERRAVGKRVGQMLDALGLVNTWLVKGGDDTLENDLWMFRVKVMTRLRDQGWRVYQTEQGKWKVR